MHHYVRLNPDRPINIALVGCGGTGSVLLSMLPRINMASQALGGGGIQVTAYDGDSVSESNVGRQSFFQFDIGRNKATVLMTRINTAYGLNWNAKPVMFEPQESQRYDLIISCVDVVSVRRSIHDFLNRSPSTASQYWLDCGNAQETGQVILGSFTHIDKVDEEDVPNLPTIIDMFPGMEDYEEESGPSCSLAEAIESQDLAINPMIANHAFHLLWKMVKNNRLENHGAFINLKNGMTVPQKIIRS